MKKRYTHTMGYYSAVLEKNGVVRITSKWMELEIIILSEDTQTQKDEGDMVSLICGC